MCRTERARQELGFRTTVDVDVDVDVDEST
jgi:hypothetical protein